MNNEEQYLKGNHAVVTGSGGGIGFVVANRLAELGATLTLMELNPETLKEAAGKIPGSTPVQIDITKEEAVEPAFAEARKVNGRIDILVNNVGNAVSSPFMEITAAQWQMIMNINLLGTFLCCKAALPDMLAKKWGRIINVASSVALKGCAYAVSYSAAKHGVVGLTRSLALEYARTNVTFNSVCPGYTQTALLERSLEKIVATTGRPREEAAEALLRMNPQHRFIQPPEIAETVAWLCRKESSSVTGQSIAIAGGEIM